MIPLGAKIRELRRSKGLSRQVLVARGCTQALIAQLEQGTRRYVTSQDIRKLSAALEVPEEELWAEIPNGQREAYYIRISERP